MKSTKIYFASLVFFISVFSYSQSIEIGSGAEINVGANSDICASNWGSISGYLTGSGTQCDDALPVEIISLTASLQNERDINIAWVTSIEINNHGFEIERKYGSSEWVKIAFVNGFGNSGTPREYNYTDRKLNKGSYEYRLKQIDYNGHFEYFLLNSIVEVKAPVSFNLSQNYPNPSNPASTISYQIPYFSKVTIKIYDASGREVAELMNKTLEAGYYELKFDGSSLASGVYFYSISAQGEGNTFVAAKKMLLVK